MDHLPQVLRDNAQLGRVNPQPFGFWPLALCARSASLHGLGPIPDDDPSVEFPVNDLSKRGMAPSMATMTRRNDMACRQPFRDGL
jgi:hypothetical protein